MEDSDGVASVASVTDSEEEEQKAKERFRDSKVRNGCGSQVPGSFPRSLKSTDDLRNDQFNVKPTQKLTHALNTPHIHIGRTQSRFELEIRLQYSLFK